MIKPTSAPQIPTTTATTETSATTAVSDSPMPAEELAKKPLFRHIDFFDANKDGKLTASEIAAGLQRMGMSKLQAELVGVGTVAVRGPATSGKFEIDIANAMKSEQAGSTHLYQADGSVDMKAVEAFISKLNPSNKSEITIDDFANYGKQLAHERVPGDGIIDMAKRGVMEAEFKIAWNGIFSAVGQTGADGKKFLTNDDVRWFYDGSLFYRRAADVAAEQK
jgi:hypothetical protein